MNKDSFKRTFSEKSASRNSNSAMIKMLTIKNTPLKFGEGIIKTRPVAARAKLTNAFCLKWPIKTLSILRNSRKNLKLLYNKRYQKKREPPLEKTLISDELSVVPTKSRTEAQKFSFSDDGL